jgi:hypothetical protein
MIYQLNNNQFSIFIPGIKRHVKNMRHESDLRAKELSDYSKKILISLSSGIDSQSMVHSFYTQNLNFETSFLYCKGYNDIEYEQLQILIKKYNLNTIIVEIDPLQVQDRVEYESLKYKIQKNQIFQKLYLEKLPDDYDFVQINHDPFVYIDQNENFFYYIGYHSPEISRDRAFKLLNRKGRIIFYGDTSEFLYSILSDDIYLSALYSYKYFDGNNLKKNNVYLKTVDRWDYYIKPLLYGKYWKNELEYFPKYSGFENIPFLSDDIWFKQNGILISYFNLIEQLRSGNDQTYYQKI